VLICSDHRSAVEVTNEIVGKIPNMRPLDAGELAMATPIESFTAVLLQLNMHYKTRVAVRLTGIPEAKIAAERAASAAAARNTLAAAGSNNSKADLKAAGADSAPTDSAPTDSPPADGKAEAKASANAKQRPPKDTTPA
jgi:hypothetical protein